MSESIALLCAGAAKGLALALEPAFTAATGAGVDASFGAVGALIERLDADAPCDVIVLTSALIETLERDGRVTPGTASALGRVHTGIAVRAGEPLPDIHDESSLRASLLGAARLFVPDPQRATAGIHFVDVLRRLRIYDDVASRLAAFPNGAAAMAALAQTRDHAQIGCTQVTEINYTEGVALAGPLPAGFDLATVYATAVSARARRRDLAQCFVRMLTGADARDLRARGGFEN